MYLYVLYTHLYTDFIAQSLMCVILSKNCTVAANCIVIAIVVL